MSTLLKIGILILGIIFFIWVISKNKTSSSNTISSCPSSFTIQPFGIFSGAADLVTTTYSMNGGKYYKKESGGIAGYGLQLPPREISKDEFESACKSYKSQNANNQ